MDLLHRYFESLMTGIVQNRGTIFLRKPSFWVSAFLVLLLTVSYSNSFHGPFIFDDLNSISGNRTLRSLPDSLSTLSLNGETVSGRPILNFSLALNYKMGRLAVESYHVVNFLIHLLSTLVLFGFLQRTFRLSFFSTLIQRDSVWLAGGIAALWGIHPLQTESVTYVVQRAESLMGLFYLLTLYFFVRSLQSPYQTLWSFLSVLSCFLGMGTKEVMVSAPMVVLLYDRFFVLGSFPKIWKERRIYYGALIFSWIVLLGLIFFVQGRGSTVGFQGHISVFDYLQTQCWAVMHYLQLVFWPHPLVLDYGTGTITEMGRVLPSVIGIVFLLGFLFWAFWRFPQWGFWGGWGLLILLPSSSVIPVTTQTIAEHRLYLALIPIFYYLVLGGYRWLGRSVLAIVLLWVIFLAYTTYERNEDYKTVEAIWRSTVLGAPLNPRAHNNYGGELLAQGRGAEAEKEFKETLSLDPKYVGAYNNLGYLYQHQGLFPEAEKMYQTALQLDGRCSDSYLNLALLFEQQGKIEEAMQLYRKNLQIAPQHYKSTLNLGNLCLRTGNRLEAEALYRRCTEINPEDPMGYNNWAHIEELKGGEESAFRLYEKAIQLDPNFIDARYNLGLFFQKRGNYPASMEQYQAVLKLHPDFVDAKMNLANLFLLQGNEKESFNLYQEIVGMNPRSALPYFNMGALFQHRGDQMNAEKFYKKALQRDPQNQAIQDRLGQLKQQEKIPQAPTVKSRG
ncbi:MAG: tetratricopeptide repeat protein [Verrucomicrobiota bacterium]